MEIIIEKMFEHTNEYKVEERHNTINGGHSSKDVLHYMPNNKALMKYLGEIFK